MDEPAYRAQDEEEPARQAPVASLLPATRERLRQACDQGEALASVQPRWVGRPWMWLIAAGILLELLAGPLIGSFGHIDEHPFATRAHERVLLAGAWVVVGVFGLLTLRSRALRRGGLPTGVYLFASGLVTIEGGRVQVWPLSRVRAVRQGKLAEVDLGPAGSVSFVDEDEDLSAALDASVTQLAVAEAEHDEVAVARLDPLHLEHERRAAWTPLPASERLPTMSPAPGVVQTQQVLGSLLVIGLSVVGGRAVRLVSDELGIRRAVQGHDLTALATYVQEQGPRSRRADRDWLAMAAQDPSDDSLLTYLTYVDMAPLRSDHRPAEAARLLAQRALRRSTLGRWDERPSRVTLHTATPDDRREPAPTLDAVVELLARCLATGLLDQAMHAQVDERLFELRLAQARLTDCSAPSLRDEERRPEKRDRDPLATYVDETTARGEEARAVRSAKAIDLAIRCRTLGDLEELRAMARTPAQRATFEATWKMFFEGRRAETMRLSALVDQDNGLSARLFYPIRDLWVHLASHPETLVRAWSSLRGGLSRAPAAANDASWGYLIGPAPGDLSSTLADSVLPVTSRELPPDIRQWQSLADGPRLVIAWRDSTDTDSGAPGIKADVQVTLTRPRQEPFRDHYPIHLTCPPGEHFDRKQATCVP